MSFTYTKAPLGTGEPIRVHVSPRPGEAMEDAIQRGLRAQERRDSLKARVDAIDLDNMGPEAEAAFWSWKNG